MKSFLLIGIGIFVLVNALSFAFRVGLASVNIPLPALLYGNAWLFGVTGLSFYFELKGVREKNTYAFLRNVYTGMLLKMFLSIAAVLTYALTDRAAITRGVVLLWVILYVAYTWVEISRLLRFNKEAGVNKEKS
jgi:hypothetical protein